MAQSKESKKPPQKGDHDIWEGVPKHADEDLEILESEDGHSSEQRKKKNK